MSDDKHHRLLELLANVEKMAKADRNQMTKLDLSQDGAAVCIEATIRGEDWELLFVFADKKAATAYLDAICKISAVARRIPANWHRGPLQ